MFIICDHVFVLSHQRKICRYCLVNLVELADLYEPGITRHTVNTYLFNQNSLKKLFMSQVWVPITLFFQNLVLALLCVHGTSSH